MEEDHSDLIAQFVSITDGSAADAEHLLEASGWDLGQAMQLYFDTRAHDPPAPAHVDALAEPPLPAVAPMANEWQGQARAQPAVDEFGVRVPDSVVTERLVAGLMQPRARPSGRSGGQMLHLPFSEPPQNAGARTGPGLNSVYPPPTAIMSDLSLEELKHTAEHDNKWLLFNVQDPTIFASLQLNADLWSDSLVQEVVKRSFVFAQRILPDQDARELQEGYDLHVLPAIIVVDPNTGQKMHERRGNVTVERFLEELSPFLDMDPSDPNAGSLVSAVVKQQAFQSRNNAAPDIGAQGIVGVSAEDESLHEAIAASLGGGEGAPAPAGPSGAALPTPAAAALGGIDDDEAAIAAAIAASLNEDAARAAQGGAGLSGAAVSGGGGGATVIDDDTDVVEVDGSAADKAAAMEDVPMSGPERKAVASDRLPPEPPAEGSARIALQLPSGRVIRRFTPESPVSTIFDFALTQLGDDEATNDFDLVAIGVADGLASRQSDTIEAAGLASGGGMLLRLRWRD
eukprot:jgi/Ulvmu1/9536/UM053_0025.1